MTPSNARRTTLIAVAAGVGGLVVGGIAGAAIAGIGSSAAPTAPPAAATTPEASTPSPSVEPAQAATDPVEGCPDPTVSVATADELQEGLDAALPGDVIALAPGVYVGEFVARESGTADDPIWLCGTADAVLDGDGIKGGYVVHLDGAQHWRLVGFSVTNGQKGVMADGTVGSEIRGLTVSQIGDEAIHLRKASTDNVVAGNTISDTGLRKPQFGEGVYVGTAESNWCDITDCEPDPSDRNIVEDNEIFGTTAEAVDIKEGTSDGIVRNNTFDGSALVEDDADSWVDVKGNDWLIEGNTGVNSPMDGYQTHEILDGWGTRNVFRSNSAAQVAGFGFSLTPERDNIVECDNEASNAGEGLTNVDCR